MATAPRTNTVVKKLLRSMPFLLGSLAPRRAARQHRPGLHRPPSLAKGTPTARPSNARASSSNK